jgi:CHAT domain-containing protein/tetratricopeptide (TPR) repeat protein
LTVDLGRCERYLCVMFKGLIILALMVVPAAVWSAQTGEVSSEHPAEYMIYQYPDVSLVVKIDAPEVEFESRIFGPEGALIKSSRIPSGRIGPLYQLIGAVDKPRQLMIKVSPERRINRSGITMELTQLPAWDRNSAELAHAYRLLSVGTESTHSNDTTTWAMKTYTLRNAADVFAGMGWEEMRLWCEFQAAHLVLHKLNDELQALELAREIQKSARTVGFDLIELAALILEGDALMKAGESSGGRVANARFEQIHAVLDRVAILAERLDLKSEQARALFNDGLAYQQQDQPNAAIRQFQRALDVSLSADNPELVNEIRGTAATTYESLGSTADAINMLEDIGGDLERVTGQELTDNLFERGRILNASFRYPEAASELDLALNLHRSDAANSAPWGPVGLALAWSYYSMGDMDRAASLILESIPRTPQSLNADALGQAYDSLANIFRDQGDFTQMAIYRGKQGVLARTVQQRSELAFESAKDAWHRGGSHSREAQDLLIRARQAATAAGDMLSGQRADLYLCLLKIEQEGRGGCTAAEVSRQHGALKNSGLPKLAMESDFVTAKILRREGRNGDALAVMERLIEEILLLRQALPGVLGAWYWQTKGSIFDEYMAITLEASAADGLRPVDGKRVLLALIHIRLIESDQLSPGNEYLERSQGDDLRSLIARRGAATGKEAEILAVQANKALQTIPRTMARGINPLTPASLDQILARLKPDESLLTYFLGDSGDYVLIGAGKGVSMLRLPGTPSVSDRLIALREQIQKGSASLLPKLDSMGRDLLGPVANRLTRKILLLPAGALNGFPFDALRLEGRFLAENHEVVNLMGLSITSALHSSLPPNYRDSVFLAGDPQASQELFNYEVRISPEISAVTDSFVGPGLHIIQGVALRRDEFQDTSFTGAGLLHLAMPGTIDLANPDRSRLLMSGAGVDSVVEYLSPADIRRFHFQASLAVLSHTNVSGGNFSEFNSRLGFVSDFLDRGVSNVVASMWVGEDSGSTTFVTEFYDNLEASRDVAAAFSLTRKKHLKTGNETNFRSWAGFQLFIR